MKIGITGSISSGKSTVSNLFLKNKNLIFSADKVVKDLYNSNDFKKKISKKFKIRKDQIKKKLKKVIDKKNYSQISRESSSSSCKKKNVALL